MNARLKNFHSNVHEQSWSFETSLNAIPVKQGVNSEWPSGGIILRLVQTAQANAVMPRDSGETSQGLRHEALPELLLSHDCGFGF